MDESLRGHKLGAYRVDELIGEGAMGEVYRGVHEELGRRVAIKALKRAVAANTELVNRFFAEAKAVNIICHENIVECTDLVHVPNGRSYIVMELLEGRTLSAVIRDGRLLPQDAVRIAAQIASAIGAAHAKSIVHRDLKPDNVFLISRAGRSDYVKVLDFGIARLQGLAATELGTLIGTPAYMSPEQAAGERAVPASDIYSLGVILFQLVTGTLPLSGDTLHEMLAAHLSKQPPRADALVAEVPAPLADAIAQALAKQADQRPDSMETFRARILDAVGLPAGPAVRPTPVPIALEATGVAAGTSPASPASPARAAALSETALPPAIGTTSVSSAVGESLDRGAAARAPGPRSRARWAALAGAAVVVSAAAVVGWRWTHTRSDAAPPPTLDDLLVTSCDRTTPPAGDAQLTCDLVVTPELPADPEARPWIAYIPVTPKPGVTLRDERGCGHVASFGVERAGAVHTVTGFVVTDCLLVARTAHDYRTRLAVGTGATQLHVALRLTVSTPIAQRDQGYKTLMGNRSYALADVWFLDAERRAEQVLAERPGDPVASQTLARSIYYRAYTRYLRLFDCATRHRVEGKPCSHADMDAWYADAIQILDSPLALALKRPSMPPIERQRAYNDRARLTNELLLRFSKGAIGHGSSVSRALLQTSGQCTDSAQQSRAFLALIAAGEGRGRDATEHLTAMLDNLTEMPARCAKDPAERDSLIRSTNSLLLAEYGMCSHDPVLKDITGFVCTVIHEFPELHIRGKPARACADAAHDRDDALSAAVRLFVIDVRRRLEGLPWRGGCHLQRLAAHPGDVTGAPMGGAPDAITVGDAPAAADDTSWHFVIDADGHLSERRPTSLRGNFPPCGARRQIGIAVARGSELASAVAEELIDELRARYAIPADRVVTAGRCGRR